MAIQQKIIGFYAGVDSPATANSVAAKKFQLANLSDTEGIIDPQTGNEVTARAVRVNVAGTLSLVDPFGNITNEAVAAGELLEGLCNAVRATGTVTIVAADITIYL